MDHNNEKDMALDVSQRKRSSDSLNSSCLQSEKDASSLDFPECPLPEHAKINCKLERKSYSGSQQKISKQGPNTGDKKRENAEHTESNGGKYRKKTSKMPPASEENQTREGIEKSHSKNTKLSALLSPPVNIENQMYLSRKRVPYVVLPHGTKASSKPQQSGHSTGPIIKDENKKKPINVLSYLRSQKNEASDSLKGFIQPNHLTMQSGNKTKTQLPVLQNKKAASPEEELHPKEEAKLSKQKTRATAHSQREESTLSSRISKVSSAKSIASKDVTKSKKTKDNQKSFFSGESIKVALGKAMVAQIGSLAKPSLTFKNSSKETRSDTVVISPRLRESLLQCKTTSTVEQSISESCQTHDKSQNNISVSGTGSLDSFNAIDSVSQIKNLGLSKLRRSGEKIQKDACITTETASISMSKMFREMVQDPERASQILLQQKPFNEHSLTTNEREALKKACKILHQAGQPTENNEGELEKDPSRDSVFVNNIEETEEKVSTDKKNKFLTEGYSKSLQDLLPGITLWSTEQQLRSEYFISLTKGRRNLTQVAGFPDRKFQLDFLGSDTGVRRLLKAHQSNQACTQITAPIVIEILDRVSSFAIAKLQAAKFNLNEPLNKLSQLHNEFTGYAETAIITSLSNLRTIRENTQFYNMFAAFFHQSCLKIHLAITLMVEAIDKMMDLVDIIGFSTVPAVKKESKQHQSEKENMLETLKKDGEGESSSNLAADALIVASMKTLNETTEFIKFVSPWLKVNEKKMKKSWRKSIELLSKSLNSMKADHNIEFGALLAMIACNITVLKSLQDDIPSLSVSSRKKVIGNMDTLSVLSNEYKKMIEKMISEASVLSEATFSKLVAINHFEKTNRLEKYSFPSFFSRLKNSLFTPT